MYKELIANWKTNKEISSDVKIGMLDVITKVFPLIVLSNLTKNEYILLRDEGFLYHDVLSYGRYDDMVDDGAANIHSNYQEVFYNCFGRDSLKYRYSRGETEVYAEVYQKNRDNQYHWVSIHTIRLPDEDGDIIQVGFTRTIPGTVAAKNFERK